MSSKVIDQSYLYGAPPSLSGWHIVAPWHYGMVAPAHAAGSVRHAALGTAADFLMRYEAGFGTLVSWRRSPGSPAIPVELC
jgi:hypothetical protein